MAWNSIFNSYQFANDPQTLYQQGLINGENMNSVEDPFADWVYDPAYDAGAPVDEFANAGGNIFEGFDLSSIDRPSYMYDSYFQDNVIPEPVDSFAASGGSIYDGLNPQSSASGGGLWDSIKSGFETGLKVLATGAGVAAKAISGQEMGVQSASRPATSTPATSGYAAMPVSTTKTNMDYTPYLLMGVVALVIFMMVKK